MFPKWDNEYSIHNATIDKEHEHLFELAGKVEYMFDRPVYKDEIKGLLADFFDYMKNHFHNEEKYMQLIKYPELEEHRKIHKEIIQSMINLIKSIKSTNDLKEKLYVVSKKWLLEHILQEDMKIEKWRKSQILAENNTEVDFNIPATIEPSHEDHAAVYFYTCACAGLFHDVPFNIHQKIKFEHAVFNCKKCKQPIKFSKKQVGSF